MLSLSSLPVLVHQFMKVTPGPLNVLSNYCFLEAVGSDVGILLLSGKLPERQKSPSFVGAPLLCHRSEMSVRTCRTLPPCHFLHPNVSVVPWHAFTASRASGHLVLQSLNVKQLVLCLW